MRRLGLVIVVRPDRLGDVCVSISVLEALRRDSPETRVIWVSQEIFRPLVEGHPNVAEFWALPPSMGWLERRRLIAKIRSRKPDAALLLQKNISRLWGKVMAQAKISLRVGAAEEGRTGRRLTVNTCEPGLAWHQQHEARKSLNILGAALEIPIADAPSQIRLTDTVLRDVAAELSKLDIPTQYFVVQLGTGGSNRPVPPEFFARVSAMVSEKLNLTPVITGIASESHLEEAFAATYRRLFCSVTGKTGIAALTEIVRRAKFVLSVDTGTVHVAAAVQTPSVVLMPKYCVAPKQWRAWCAPTEIIRPRRFCLGCDEWKCLNREDLCISSISEDDTFQACVRILQADVRAHVVTQNAPQETL